MPAAQRWNAIYGTFRSGQLSPAAQDDVNNDVWMNGAAKITNFRIERDGGLSPRPALRRSDIRVLVPTRGLLAGARINVPTPPVEASPDFTDPIRSGPSLYTDVTPYGPPYGAEGGALWLGDENNPRIFHTRGAPSGTPLLRLVFPEPVTPGAITFHGVRLVGASDRIHRVEGVRRLNLAVWLGTGSPNVIGGMDGRWAAPGTGGADDEDELEPGAFSPGIVRRDLVIPCDGNLATEERPPLTYIDIRCRLAGESVSVGIDGISCFDSKDGVALPSGVLERPFRILPWSIRSIPYVLTLGMDHMQWVQLHSDEAEEPLVRISGESIWHFTARQLRELTWATYGGNLLLAHHDFPHLLEVRLPTGGRTARLEVAPLDLRNIPFVTEEARDRVLPEISQVGGTVELAAVGVAPEQRIPFAPAALTEMQIQPTAVLARWPDTGADGYEVEVEGRPGPSLRATAPFVLIDRLTQGTRYRIRIRGYIGLDESQWSPYSTFETTKRLATPDAPTLVVSPAGIEGRIGISWNAVPQADGYELLVSPTLTTPISVASTSYNFDGDGGQEYEIRVRAVALSELENLPALGRFSENSRSEYSMPSSATARNVKPGAPTGISMTQGAISGQIDMSWTAGVGADRYEIQWTPFLVGFESMTTPPRAAGTATGTSGSFNAQVGDRGVELGTIISVRIRSLRDHADPGDWVSPTPGLIAVQGGRPPAPTGLIASTSRVRSGLINLQWDEVDGATSYVWAVRPAGTTQWTENGAAQTSAEYPGTAGTTFQFRVRARIPDSAEGAWSNIVSVQAVAITEGVEPEPEVRGVPELQLSHGSGDGDIATAWSDIAGASGYTLEYRRGSSGGWTTVNRTAAQRTYTIDGTAGSYQVRVRARFSTAPTTSSWSTTQTFVATLRAPGAVTGFRLRATRGNEPSPINGQTTIEWNTVATATAYEFERYTDAALTQGQFQRSTNAPRTSRRIGGTVGTAYWWRMRAVRTGANAAGPWTDPQRFVASNLDTADLPGPTISVAPGASKTQVVVSWTTIAAATGYVLESKTGTDAFSAISGVTGTSHTFTGALGTSEAFRVKAQFSGGTETAWSSEVVHHFRRAGPTLTLSAGTGEGVVSLSWTAVTGHTSWLVEVQFGSGEWTAIGSSDIDQAARTASYAGTAGTTYKFRVRGAASGTTPATDWSDEESITIRRAGPILSATGGTAAGRINLTWTEVSGATSYRLEQKSGTGNFAHVPAVTGTGRSYTYPGTGGTTYTFRIRATTADGDTEWSPEVTETAPQSITTSPTGTASVREETALTIDLSDITGATRWAHREVVSGTPGSPVSHTSRRIRLTGLTAGTSYIYQFRAGNSLGDGPWSANQTFSTITVDEDDAAPTGLSVRASVTNVRTAGGDAQTFEWRVTQFLVSATLPAGAVGWDLRYSLNLDPEPEASARRTISLTGTGSVSYNIPYNFLSTNRIYYVSARARYADGSVSNWGTDLIAVFPYVQPRLVLDHTGAAFEHDFNDLRTGSLISDGVREFGGLIESTFRGFNNEVADAAEEINDNASLGEASFHDVQNSLSESFEGVTPGTVADFVQSIKENLAELADDLADDNFIGDKRPGGGGVGTGDPYGGNDDSGGGGRGG